MIITRYLEMPLSVKGCVVKDADDDFNIYINPSLSLDEQRRAYEHELTHIDKDHFYSDDSVEDKEREIT